MSDVRPLPGLGVVVLKDGNQLLMGQRKDSGLFGMPGGYLEKFETWEQGAIRELKEETGLHVDADKIHVLQVFNALEKENNYHNVAIIVLCEFPEGQEIKTMEPEKCAGWQWWGLEDLEKRFDEIFYPNRYFMTHYKHLLEPAHVQKILSAPPKYKSCFFK